MKRSYGQIIEVAEAYEITVNIEVHGYFTTNPERWRRCWPSADSPYLRLNLDTGNSVHRRPGPRGVLPAVPGPCQPRTRQGRQPVAGRGGPRAQTGIAVSHCAIGDGVNAGEHPPGAHRSSAIAAMTGVLSMECEGQGGPMIERSLAWLRTTLRELRIPEEA